MKINKMRQSVWYVCRGWWRGTFRVAKKKEIGIIRRKNVNEKIHCSCLLLYCQWHTYNCSGIIRSWCVFMCKHIYGFCKHHQHPMKRLVDSIYAIKAREKGNKMSKTRKNEVRSHPHTRTQIILLCTRVGRQRGREIDCSTQYKTTRWKEVSSFSLLLLKVWVEIYWMIYIFRFIVFAIK